MEMDSPPVSSSAPELETSATLNFKSNPDSKSTHPNNKPCTICHTPRPILIRCQIDATQTWHLVCPGKCWRGVSGGVEDAKGKEGEYPYYRYGGMWKNKHLNISAKKPKPKRSYPTANPAHSEPLPPTTVNPLDIRPWAPYTSYTRNDHVAYEGRVWVCRRSHDGGVGEPGDENGYRYWKVEHGASKVGGAVGLQIREPDDELDLSSSGSESDTEDGLVEDRFKEGVDVGEIAATKVLHE